MLKINPDLNMKTGMDKKQKLIDEFKALTFKALEEIDGGTFIEILIKRDEVIKKIIKENIELTIDEIDYLYGLEEKVSERLEAERKNVIEGISAISEKMKAIRKYTPKFPFPPMPAFFDKKG